eukprot:scaffold1615_cov103-Isochrysis_galbana.AAC.9
MELQREERVVHLWEKSGASISRCEVQVVHHTGGGSRRFARFERVDRARILHVRAQLIGQGLLLEPLAPDLRRGEGVRGRRGSATVHMLGPRQ